MQRSDKIPIKIPADSFSKTSKPTLKFICKHRGSPIAKTMFKKQKTKLEGLHFPISKFNKTLQYSTGIKTDILDQGKKIETPDINTYICGPINPYIYNHLIFDKDAKSHTKQKHLLKMDHTPKFKVFKNENRNSKKTKKWSKSSWPWVRWWLLSYKTNNTSNKMNW